MSKLEMAISPELKAFREWEAKIECLTKKYIGERELERGRSMADIIRKRQWYLSKLVDLGRLVGIQQQRKARTRRTDSETYKRYDAIQEEVYQVTESLKLEMLDTIPRGQ